MDTRVSKITAVLNPGKAGEVIQALQQAGIRQIATEVGRSPVLEETRGLSSLLSTGGLRLASDPVEIVSFFVESHFEDDMISLVAENGRLHIAGMGSVYSQAVQVIRAHPQCPVEGGVPLALPKPENLYAEVIGLSCTVVRGEGDRIARAVLQSGACVPVITYGTGTGVRDKLGLLRITLPAEKEVITVVMSSYDAEPVMELMIQAGRLEQLGRGILYVFPVKQGIVNTRITRGAARHAASMEQIISTLDSLKGGMEWRRRGTEFEGRNRSFLRDKVNLSIECDEGRGTELVQAAMGAGAAGATINRYKMVGTEPVDATLSRPSPAREICNMIVKPEDREGIAAALSQEGLLDEHTHGVITAHPVPKAFFGHA